MTEVEIKKVTLKEYIQEVRGISISQAASELGYSRVWLTDVANGNKMAGGPLCRRIQVWSNDQVDTQSLQGL